MVVFIVPAFILGLLVAGLIFALISESKRKQIEEDVHDYNNRVIKKRIAGHKASYTRVRGYFKRAMKVLKRRTK